MNPFTEKIQFVMIKRKVKGPKVAEALGISHQQFYKQLHSTNPKWKSLEAISNALNCDIEVSLVMRDTGEKI